MNATDFVGIWSQCDLTERSGAQQHFLNLCELLGHPKPAQADPTGDSFTFERGAAKQDGGDGWADVWKKGFFGWEYKGKHKDLDAAYSQLQQYREALENPPLLVVCDMQRIIVHTNFTNTATRQHEIRLAELDTPRNLEILRAVFFDPDKLKPGVTSEAITTTAAQRLADVALSMRDRGLDPQAVAHFLDRIVFCLFAEDVGLLPHTMFSQIVQKCAHDPKRFGKYVAELFAAMASGGVCLMEDIRHFNGNLFDNSPVLDLTTAEIASVQAAATLDWSAVDASIFGTLFERGMDPAKRSQLGAHYTSREDIHTLVEPVVMQPLRREWAEVRAKADALWGVVERASRPLPTGPTNGRDARSTNKSRAAAEKLFQQFLQRLQAVRVLDPACGSGNFLYVTLQKLLDLEKEVNVRARDLGFTPSFPQVHPQQLHGIEINSYAHDLAQMTCWIGYIQWLRANGYGFPAEPILRRLDQNFQCADALTASWPAVDFIVGNPPFLGGSKIWDELGRNYQEKLWQAYKDRVPGGADFCCYWFERARAHIEAGKVKRAGLLATQGIRGGANREVLKRIKDTGDIFFAESDRPWILDGANVHVSMVGFDNGDEKLRILDGHEVMTINPNLTATTDTTVAKRLKGLSVLCFRGAPKVGRFEMPDAEAVSLLSQPNPSVGLNSDVLRPWANGLDVVRRPRSFWIVDFFPIDNPTTAAQFELPYKLLLERVYPSRQKNKREHRKNNWWLHAETCEGLRKAVAPLHRFIATLSTSKYRLFVWLKQPTFPDQQLYVIARDDDFSFGVLHSRLHEVWSLKQGTRLETRPRYTPTTCFETFPFPAATAEQQAAIATAAKELNELRERWLNPPEWTREEVLEFPASVHGPWSRYVVGRDGSPSRPHPITDAARSESTPYQQIGTARYPRLVPKDADCAKKLAKRTLTNLYNERPTWLANAHAKLDAAVCAAYGWPATVTDEEILAKLLALNLSQSAASAG